MNKFRQHVVKRLGSLLDINNIAAQHLAHDAGRFMKIHQSRASELIDLTRMSLTGEDGSCNFTDIARIHHRSLG